ncbi:MAG: LuxR C-terminal-related transcriptional regulator [Deltaproteobacteria bacterium]|nr:LuxR C-terminal-related transcriptional regulator [Deltaproteobacteria bacterium]
MAGKTTTDPLITTKLHRPPLDRIQVQRPHLLERLDQGRSRPLTLVSAPAGYGKSVLIRSWLESCDIPSAWISLDENDNDLRTFTAYFVAAVKTLFPGACRNTQALLSAPDLPPIAVLVANLLNELDLIEQSFIMVLDDFHLIEDESVLDMIAQLLHHPPQTMHLVLIGRQDPAVPISKLRAQSFVTEIRTQELCFNKLETETFLRLVLGTQVDSATAASLGEKTEGWVTGLRLAALSMRHRGSLDPKLLEPHVDSQYVMEYLFTEVLSQQPPEISRYLLGTAILDRFCGPLCEAVCVPGAEPFTCETGGWEFIVWLKKENMFLISLDTENRWFRFHHLFQKLLVNQLKRHFSSEDINALHAQASAWFAENGLIEEAIRHALAADDEIGAAQLVEQNRQAMLDNDTWYVLEKWLSMFPDTVIQQRPELLLARTWVSYFCYRYALIPPIVDLAESLLNNQPQEQTLYGELYFFKGVICFFQGNGSLSLKYLEDALARIPATNPAIRSFAELYLGMAIQMHGQNERAVHVLSDLLHHQPLNDMRKVRVMGSLICVHIISGNLTVALNLNQQFRNISSSINSALYTAWSLYFQGLIHFCRNELDMAIPHLSQASDLAYLMLRRGGVDCLAGLALAYQAMQQADKAAATLERLFEYIHSLNDPALLDIAHCCKARLSLMKAEAPFAPGVPGTNKTSDAESMAFWLEIPVITQCRVLLAEGSDAGLQEAENTLQECLRLSQSQHNTLQMIGIMPLQASAFQKQGRTDEALAVLEAAVDLARPGGFIRPFVESGPTVVGLLKRLAAKNIAVDYIGRLLAAFREDQCGVKPGAFGTQTVGRPSTINQPSVDHLTNREFDILDLLAQRLQTKEIAEKLHISTETVNSHLKNIYQKLDVHNRRLAVTRAKGLGIL